jgi:dTMP kinase
VRGLYIAVEGIDGAGKSTQVSRLAERYSAVLVAEPGGTPFAKALREIVKDPSLEMGVEAEALLFASARADLIRSLILPALSMDLTVISDRSVFSSLAYQGFRDGHDRISEVWGANRLATADWTALPDLVLQIDADPETSLARRSSRGGPLDRMEAVTNIQHLIEGFGVVRTGLRTRLGAHRTTWVKIDGSGTPDEVFDEMVDAVDRYVATPRPASPEYLSSERSDSRVHRVDRNEFLAAKSVVTGTSRDLPMKGSARKSHFYRSVEGDPDRNWVSLCRMSSPLHVMIDPRGGYPSCARCQRHADAVADIDFSVLTQALAFV